VIARILSGLSTARVVGIVGAGCLAAGMLTGGLLGWRLQDARAEKIQAAWDRDRAEKAGEAFRRLRASTEATAEVGTRVAEAQVRVETRTRTLKQKVTVYVPSIAPAGVIRAGDRVPVGALVLLDAAARGDDPDGLSVTAGQSYDLASDVHFAQLVDNYIDNLGRGRQNAEQLDGLQDWVRRQQALDGR